jgi:hypothetical protein
MKTRGERAHIVARTQRKKLELRGPSVTSELMAHVMAQATLPRLGRMTVSQECPLTRPFGGAGDENRTRMTSLEGWSSAIELHPRT